MTARRTQGVLFSDLDGTFLDDRSRPVLDRLALKHLAKEWRIIWASGRTAAEILHLQREMRFFDDAIAENGGVLITRDATLAGMMGAPERVDGAWCVRMADPRPQTLTRVHNAFASAAHVPRTLADIPARELAKQTTLSVREAYRARNRQASVILVDCDFDDPETAEPLSRLEHDGCTVGFGERWLNVLRGADKGSTAQRWLECAYRWSERRPYTVAVGHAPMNASLMAAADAAFVLGAGDAVPEAIAKAVPNAVRLAPGSGDGWEQLLSILRSPTGVASSTRAIGAGAA